MSGKLTDNNDLQQTLMSMRAAFEAEGSPSLEARFDRFDRCVDFMFDPSCGRAMQRMLQCN